MGSYSAAWSVPQKKERKGVERDSGRTKRRKKLLSTKETKYKKVPFGGYSVFGQ